MTTKEKIFKSIEAIPATKHRELFEMIEQFKKKAGPAKTSKWAEFAGSLTDDDAKVMKEAIEEEFEKVEDEE